MLSFSKKIHELTEAGKMTEIVFKKNPIKPISPIIPSWWASVDRVSLTCFTFIIIVGFLLGWAISGGLAAGKNFDEIHYVRRQMLLSGLAFIVAIITSCLSVTFLRRLCIIGFFLGLLALVLLLFIGEDYGKGATRWLDLGISVQPSEFIKPVFIVFSAWVMSLGYRTENFSGNSISFGFVVIVALLLFLQPDFGQILLISITWGIMFFINGAPVRRLFVLLILLALLFFLAYMTTDHVTNRINSWLSKDDVVPFSQMDYAIRAIRQGGLFGVGLGEGQIKTDLPDAHTDFIIAVAAEEFGLLSVFFIMTLFLTITLRSFVRMARENDVFLRLAGTGLAAIFGIQAFINFAVSVQVVPTKGMTLPFISHGGSSMLASGFLIGMLLAFGRERSQGKMSQLLRGQIRE